MTSRRSAAPLRRAAAPLVVLLLLAACGGDEGSQPDDQAESEEPVHEIPQPEVEADDTIRMPIGMISPAGHSEGAPIGEDGTIESTEAPGDPVDGEGSGQETHTTEIARTEAFGCQDTISVIRTVPTVTDDAVRSAVDFLLDDPLYYHGDPSFINPLAVSEESGVDEVSVEDDTVTVELSAEPVTRSQCESWQIVNQLKTTARVASGASSASVEVDGEPLSELWGMQSDDEPLEIREITD